MNLDDETDIEGVSNTIFDDKADSLGHEHTQNLSPNEKENSCDPFNLYNLLNKRDKGEANSGLDSSLSSRVLEDAQPLNEHVSPSIDSKKKAGGSILEVIDDMIKVGQSMGFTMEGWDPKAKKDWIKELNNKHKVNFLSVQETKLDCISDMDVKVLWGNYKFEYTISEAVGNSGGILCVWDPSVFRKEHHVVRTSDNFVAFKVYGFNQAKLLVVSIFALSYQLASVSLGATFVPYQPVRDGHCMVMGDFNEVRCMEDHLGLVYNAQGANKFNSFISNSGLVEIQLEGALSRIIDQSYFGKWSRIMGLPLFGFTTLGFKKLQILKKEIRSWVNDCKKNQSGRLVDLRSKLCHIDKVVDQGGVNDDILLTRLDLLKKLNDIKSSDTRDYMQKAKIQWAIEGDENSNFFHGIINRKRANLAIKGVMVDGEWLDMLESPISRDEVRNVVWGCGENKSPGPDGFTFEFFRKFWDTLGSDLCAAVEWFFDHSSFFRGLLYKVWIGDTQLRVMFPRIYALEINKDCTVADKLQFSVTSSLRRSVRGGVESSQLALLQMYIEGTLLSNMEDRWV
ncbi:RNA-directed DNA polymerase, eukaryota [Tanacetum coccineum]